MADRQEKGRGSGGRHGLLEQYPRQITYRDLPCESCGVGALSRCETLSLGFFRGFLLVSVRQSRANRQERRHGSVHPASAKNAQSLRGARSQESFTARSGLI